VHFEILKGYIGVPSEKLFNFLSDNSKIGKIHKNEKLKMHACITDLKGLEQVDGLIQEITGKKQNLVKIDEEIAEQTAALWFMK